MEIEQNHILPLELAIKYYQKWDCDVTTQLHNHLYYKYLTGLGQVTFLNGNSYQGLFDLGLMHGTGTYIWKHGLKYQGTFTRNRITGKGKLTWKDCSYYIGEVVEGKRQGEGEYYCSVDKSSYKGRWSNGVKEGKGVLTFANGSIYEGQFSKGLRHGYGKMKYPSGNEYEGSWVQDKKQGEGCMLWHTTSEKYQGSWKRDLPEGKGVYYWLESKSDNKGIKTIYKGEWRQGKRQGYGAFFYNNGRRMQGTFFNNLKEGLCVMTDQVGDTQIEHYHLDKSTTLKLEEKPFKLSDLSKPMIHNNEPAQNTYMKITDISSPHLDEAIFNLLLRENSHLRTNYRNMILSTNKEIFNGLNIEGLWKMVKELKINNDWLSLAKLNRLFYEGTKSRFEIEMPSAKKMDLLKENPQLLGEISYRDIEWAKAFKQFKELPLNWEQWPEDVPALNISKVNLNGSLEVHNQDHIVLFRHYVVYILHLTLLQHQQATLEGQTVQFRKCLEDTLSSINTQGNPVSNMPSLRTQKMCSQIMTSVSHNQTKLSIPYEYSNINKSVIDELNAQRPNLLNTVDKTVSVRQIYTLLLRCNILKQATQKILFLQRIERSMSVNSNLLRKENKAFYGGFEQIVLTSPHFAHIMNYQMIGIELDEILFKLLNRKIGNAHSKQEFQKKYKEIIKSMVAELKKQKQSVNQKAKNVGFKWNRTSTKDKLREELLQRLQEERIRKEEEQRKQAELNREQWQRCHMLKEDRDVKDDEQSEQSEQYYD